MVMPIIPKALYPNVPNVAGVPALLRNPSAIIGAGAGLLNASNAIKRLIGADTVVWGVFDKTGKLIAQASSAVSVEYRNGSRISDYPLEQGAFASYNKVANPYEVRVRLTCDGTTSLSLSSAFNPFEATTHQANRTAFINALDAAANSLDLYTVVTPEKTYVNANIESWDYRREISSGANIIIADLNLREIRETATAAFSSPQTASAANVQSQGQVQTLPVPAQVTTATALR